MARRPGRKQDDIVNNFSSDVDELLDDFDDDVETDKPLSPKEYTSYRSKSKPRTQPEESNINEHDNYTDTEEVKEKRPNNRPNRNSKPSSRPKAGRPGVTRNTRGSRNNNNGKGIIMGIVALVVIALAAFFLISGGKAKGEEDTDKAKQEQTKDEEYQSVGQVNKEVNSEKDADNDSENGDTPKPPVVPEASMEDTNAINPGLPNTTNGKNKVNGGNLTDTSEFLTDINGNPIPENYEVKQIKTETDFVNYEKRRGITGEGMELLWLDAEYKGIPYTVQVPFKIWKELDPKGITVVSMEVLYLEGDYKVISHMEVKENYKELLEKKN